MIQFHWRNEINLFSIDSDRITSLKGWAKTGWDSRWSSIESFKGNYKNLVTSFQELEAEGTHRSIDARVLLLAIKEPMFDVALSITYKILGIIKVLSDQLKGRNIHKSASFFNNFSLFPQRNR